MPHALKALVVLLILCGACAVKLSAQDDELKDFKGFQTLSPYHKKAIIKSSIIPLFEGQNALTGEVRITYEQTLARRQSITVSGSYDYTNFILLAISGAGNSGGKGGGFPGSSRRRSLNQYSIEGGRVTLGYRYYFSKKHDAPNGFYFGPYLSYNAVEIREKQNQANYEVVNYMDASGIIGYQVTGKRHFAFDIFFGAGYKNNFVTHYNNVADAPYYRYVFHLFSAFKYVKIAAQMNFGYAF